jgi:hypothetical protein
VNSGAPTVVDVTVKVTTPEPLEGPEAGEIVSVAPRLEASVTVLPETGLLLASLSVTVIVEVVEPSAVTELGEAPTVEALALTAPAVMLKLLLVALISEPSVALKV